MFCLSSGSLYPYGLNRVFEIAKETGFKGLEIVMNQGYDSSDASYLQELSQKNALPIVALKTPTEGNSPKKIEQALKIAGQIKIPIITVRSPLFTDFKFTQWFKTELPKLQKNTNIKIAVENVPYEKGGFLPKYAMRNLEDLRRFDHLCLDTSHIVTQKLNLLKVYGVVHKRIALVHLSNYNNNQHHQLLKDGIVPLESFLTKLKADEFAEPVILKVTPEALGGDDLNLVKTNLKAQIAFYDKYFA
ncbi:MAG: sugar phosphate isomerase/epimerase [Candidatus Gracilibacteria bacterium]|nr:sugar phosphate isomerase/epimerase [Candidatus Gracilibacteria bacterium]